MWALLENAFKASISKPLEKKPLSPDGSRCLDQWRGGALLLVLVSHGGFCLTPYVQGIGRVGVNLFFFISGVLVYRSLAGLCESRKSDGKLTLEFSKRRVFRLLPALLLYLGVIALIVALAEVFRLPFSIPPTFWPDLLYSLGFVRNHFGDGNELATGHLWSIACEVQFYILAPLLFIFARRANKRAGLLLFLSTGIFVIFGFLGAAKVAGFTHKYAFHVAVWPMFFGVAYEHFRFSLDKFVIAARKFVFPISILLFCFCALAVALGSKTLVIFLGAMLTLLCAVAYSCGLVAEGRLGKGLEFLGQRTYSIYLWQQPLTIVGWLPTPLHPLGALISVLVGSIGFQISERPFIRRGKKSSYSYRKLVFTIVLFVGVSLPSYFVWSKVSSYRSEITTRVIEQSGHRMGKVLLPPVGSSSREAVLLLGDSRIEQWPASLSLTTLPQINLGLGNQTSSELLAQIGSWGKRGNEPPFEIAVVQCGINDLKAVGASPELADRVSETTLENIIACARIANGYARKVVVSGIAPVGPLEPLRIPFWSEEVEIKRLEINQSLEKVAQCEGFIYMDSDKILGGEDQPGNYVDALHFSPDGYRALASRWGSFLETQLK